MGIRMMQWIGLNERANQMILGEPTVIYWETISRRYPDGRVETLPEMAIHGTTVRSAPTGFVYLDPFDQEDGSGVALHEYHLPDGQKLIEKIQSDEWSSGPVVFTAFQDSYGQWIQESLWTEEEMERLR